VDSDEVLYYVDGDFMSRRGIEEGSITLHPSGLPHPGKIEASIGKKKHRNLLLWSIHSDRCIREKGT
jgi:homogentisate 1,2-dioxygenase